MGGVFTSLESDTFHALPGHFDNNNMVKLLAGTDNKIYVCGDFITIDAKTVNKIARWNPNANTWEALTFNTNHYGLDQNPFSLWTIQSMILDWDNTIVVCGFFSNKFESDCPIQYIGRWHENGINSYWEDLGIGLIGSMNISRIAYHPITHDFYAYGPVFDNNTFLRQENNTSWRSFGETPFPQVNIQAMAFDAKGNLYVGGYFSRIGGVQANNIAKWAKK